MGGFFQLVDLKQGRMARKIGTQKRNVGGLEAPRNSLDLPVETHKSYYPSQDDGLHKYQETHDWSEMDSYPAEAPMKKLISDEISKRPKTRTNSPSIVARLMGVDALPPDTKNSVNESSKEKLARSSSVGSALSPSKSFRKISFDSFNIGEEDSDLEERSGSKTSKKHTYVPREHPQEEELQKFKKEFEAWQSARFKESSKIVEHDTPTSQFIAQDNLNKQKMILYANSERKSNKIQDQENKRHQSLEPTRIVILRPGFDNINQEEPFASSSGASEDRNNIEDFLEEVKERLKCELEGKTFKRGGGIETPYSEKLSNPKQIAKRIANQVRESVTKDFESNLIRSESTRSYTEFISRDTRRVLSDRLRNVLKRESHSNMSMDLENSLKSSILSRKSQSRDGFNHSGDLKSFRYGFDDVDTMSPINLVRSLSAPVSGTSFGKLLLEDRHVLTGAQIRRKHEKVKKQRKDKFNLKERVSSFRGRLFGRKIHSTTEFRDNDRSFVKDIMNGQTVMMNFAYRPENSTEVPPSPASVCSSVHEDFYRAAYCVSPTTTGAPPSDDNDLPQAFRDISSNLNELRKQLNQLETGQTEEINTIEDQPQPFELATEELENEEEAYIQDLLIASGLYNNSFDKSLSRWDTFAKPISKRVFEQVEESHKNNMNHDQKKIDHKILLDLLNEVLSTTLSRPPRGNTLFDHVWSMLRAYLRPHVDNSFYFFDTMVARDLRSMPWSEMVNEETGALAKEVECEIIRDLIEETVKDIMR